jgi:ribonuclease HI
MGDRIEYTIYLHFWATNNMAEYEALIHGLRIASELSTHRLFIRGDSELFVSQIMKEASCHDSKMVAYCNEVQKLEERFDGIEHHHILRRDNLVVIPWPRSHQVKDQLLRGYSSMMCMNRQ